MRNTVMWGQYILFFMFFVGLSAGGLIVASAGRLFGVKTFKPITRLAVLEATVAVILAAHRSSCPTWAGPERVLNILLHPNPTSPMIWDITIVIVYMALSALYVWLYTPGGPRPAGQLAGPRDRHVGTRRWPATSGSKTVLAWIALPAGDPAPLDHRLDLRAPDQPRLLVLLDHGADVHRVGAGVGHGAS